MFFSAFHTSAALGDAEQRLPGGIPLCRARLCGAAGQALFDGAGSAWDLRRLQPFSPGVPRSAPERAGAWQTASPETWVETRRLAGTAL